MSNHKGAFSKVAQSPMCGRLDGIYQEGGGARETSRNCNG
ncbi:hypothetical protein TIFTF001_034276 [Ficus carica]|uniref:Uncharacterized protein n=1 Tax=Ficus carica TaxID=3494 RepID=A0AA88J4Y0_FICCA|nr:hypothetical protein TIFTF001_034276 [Ficus carica]